jgi:hypothetical protein
MADQILTRYALSCKKPQLNDANPETVIWKVVRGYLFGAKTDGDAIDELFKYRKENTVTLPNVKGEFVPVEMVLKNVDSKTIIFTWRDIKLLKTPEVADTPSAASVQRTKDISTVPHPDPNLRRDLKIAWEEEVRGRPAEPGRQLTHQELMSGNY